jgi:hypothetical protein
MRSKLTVWKEDQFTVLPFQTGVRGCVQAQWSTEEDTHCTHQTWSPLAV